MTAGLQVFKADGTLAMDTNNRIAKVLGTISVSANDSVYVPLLAGNTPFFFVYANQAPSSVTGGLPNVSVSSGTIGWNYPAAALACTIVYGMY